MAAYPKENPAIRIGRSGWALYAILGLLFGVYLGINQIVGLRGKANFAPWKPLVWEISSVIVILAFVPLIIRFERRFRLDSRPRWRVVAAPAAAAGGFSGSPVAGLRALREM